MKLTREEIVDLKQRLSQWQAPNAMKQLVDETMDRIGSKVLFNQGGLALLRDSWAAAQFGRIRQAGQVRLVSDPWPDFELKIDGRVEEFEVTEADDPQRRRGDEYRNATGKIIDDPTEDSDARAEQAPAWIEAACRKKVAKRYSVRANLLIYLNLNEYGSRQSEVEASFPSATEVAKDSFETIWVLWKGLAYIVWRNGKHCQPDGTVH